MRKSLQHVAAAVFLSLALAAPSWGYEKEIDALSVTMAQKIASKGKTRVAVVDFADLEGNVRYFDKFIAEQFSVALAGAGKGFRVIDRSNLNSLIKEHKLSATGMINPATAMKLGKIAGADALVTGTLTPIGDNVQLIVKVLDANTADVIDSGKINIARTQAVNELLEKNISSESTGSASVNGSQQASAKKAVTTQVVKDILFEAIDCKASGNSLTCHLAATNKKDDREIRLYIRTIDEKRSRMFDNLSSEKNVSSIDIANKKSSSDNNGNEYVDHMLVSGIQTRLTISFEGIDNKADRVALLDLTCKEITSDTVFKVQFRDIPISR